MRDVATHLLNFRLSPAAEGSIATDLRVLGVDAEQVETVLVEMRGALTGALERAYWWPHLSNGDWQREAKRYSDVARLSDELKNAIQSTHIASETHLPLAASSVSVGETILHEDLGDFEETLARLHELSAGLALAVSENAKGQHQPHRQEFVADMLYAVSRHASKRIGATEDGPASRILRTAWHPARDFLLAIDGVERRNLFTLDGDQVRRAIKSWQKTRAENPLID